MTASPPFAVTIGESMGLVHATDIGSLAHLSTLALSVGGAEGNVAIGLARLGAAVVWLGRVGSDGLGQRVARELRAENVVTRAIVDPGAPTGLMLKEHPSAGSTIVHYYRAGSAGSRLSPADLDDIDIAGAGLLHLTGITPALSESAQATVHAAIDRATRAGVPVSFDVNHRSRLWADRATAARAYREIIARCTVVFAGEDEAALVLGENETLPTATRLARGLARLGPSEVVIKRGAAGCLALVDNAIAERDAIPVTVVDTVGAGDAFVAGYLAERLAGLPLADRLDTAVRAGAFACTHPGDWEGFAFRSQLTELDGGDPVLR